MSKQVKCITTIKNLQILKKTLDEVGIHYSENNDIVAIESREAYDKIEFNLKNGDVDYDEMQQRKLNEIKQNYSKNFILNEIAIKGHRVTSVKNIGNNIEIIASY